MAVRLTPQLTSFLQPLDTDVLLKTHMRYTLSALRERRVGLMRVLDVFASEPLMDWEVQPRTRAPVST